MKADKVDCQLYKCVIPVCGGMKPKSPRLKSKLIISKAVMLDNRHKIHALDNRSLAVTDIGLEHC